MTIYVFVCFAIYIIQPFIPSFTLVWSVSGSQGVGLKGPTLKYNALLTAQRTPLVFSVSKTPTASLYVLQHVAYPDHMCICSLD